MKGIAESGFEPRGVRNTQHFARNHLERQCAAEFWGPEGWGGAERFEAVKPHSVL